MIGALALVTLRQWQQHKLRLLLTLLGTTLGIAVFFAVQTANLTLADSLQTTVTRLAGKATLQITAGEAGFSEDFLEKVRSTEGVDLAEPALEIIAKTADNENLLILGLDTTSDLKLHSDMAPEQEIVVQNPLEFINRPDSIAVSRSFAERNDLKEGDSLKLYVQQGTKNFIIRGFFKPGGAAEAFEGNIAIMDIFTAQSIFGRIKTIDRIDVLTARGTPVEEVRNRLRQNLPKGIKVRRPASRGKDLEKSISSVNLGMTIMSFLALVIGVFIIFNSFQISINQRWKEIGILRAMGVNRKQIQLMYIGEAFILGLLGALLGAIAGYFLAIGAIKVMSVIAATSYGLVMSAPKIPPVRWDFVISSFLIGIIASVIAAWIPSRSAARIDPVVALHNIEVRKKESGTNWPRILAGLGFLLTGVSLTWFANPAFGTFIQVSFGFFIVLGMVLILPQIVTLGGFVLRPPINYFFGIEGKIAVDTMIRSPGRTSATIAALMIGLAFVFSNGTIIKSQKEVLTRALDRAVNVDYFVTTSDQIRSRVYHFPEQLLNRTAKLAGVERAEGLRVTSVDFRGEEVALLAQDMESWIERAPDVLSTGKAPRVKKEMSRGEGLFISENFAFRFDLDLGDEITLETPAGSLSRKILGILEYYQSEKGTIFIERETYKKYWNDSGIDYILISLKPNIDQRKFKIDLEGVLAGEQRAFIYSQKEYRALVMNLTDQFFTLNYLQMVIAILVAALGLINTMIISVAERKREIGLLRAIGGLKKQIKKMILLESVCISIIGIVAGLLMGILIAYCSIKISVVVLAGFTLPFRFPYILFLSSIPVVIFIALLSAWIPARRAAGLEVSKAIDYE